MNQDIVVKAPFQGTTAVVHVKHGRFFSLRRRLGLWLYWLAMRVMGAAVEFIWEGPLAEAAIEEAHARALAEDVERAKTKERA